MKKVSSYKVMGINIKRKLYEGVAVPTALYGIETEFGISREEI